MTPCDGRPPGSRFAAQAALHVALRAAREASLRLAREAAAWAAKEGAYGQPPAPVSSWPRSAAFRPIPAIDRAPAVGGGVYLEAGTDPARSETTTLRLVVRAHEDTGFADETLERADSVGRSANPRLISRYAERQIELLLNRPSDGAARAQAAATALSYLHPVGLLDFLRAHPVGVGTVIASLNAAPGADWSSSLGDLIKAVGRIRPPAREALEVFDAAVTQIGGNRHARAQAARFFGANLDRLIRYYQADAGGLGREGQKKLSVFFARTLFTAPAFEGRAACRLDLLLRMAELVQALDAHAPVDPLGPTAEGKAQLLGSLVGAIEGGFQIAVTQLKRHDDAVDGMAGLVFRAAGLLPDATVPGLGVLQRLTMDTVAEWVAASVREGHQGAAAAFPLDVVLRGLIGSHALFDLYDAARRAAFTNRGVGLVETPPEAAAGAGEPAAAAPRTGP